MPGAAEADAELLTLPESLWPFARAVAGNPDAAARLGPIAAPEDFAAEAQAVAAELGIPLAPAELKAAIHPDPIGLGRWADAPRTLAAWPAEGWLPTRSVPAPDGPAFDWAWFGQAPLTEPFYEDSVRRHASRPFNLLLRTRTGIDALVAGAHEADSVPLAGIVFHMSRCGSTLLARMLGAVPGNLVLSEPEPLDAVLLWAWRERIPLDRAVPAVRAVVAALARRRGTGAERCIVKTDAWHILLLPLLRAAFPGVPWVYLFRDPVEVLVSHRRQAGMHTVAGIMPGELFAIADGHTLHPTDYAARTLEKIGRAALAGLAEGGGLAVNYPDIAAAGSSTIAAHFGLIPGAADRAAMQGAAGQDAKAPDRAFVADSAAKRATADAAILTAAVPLQRLHAQLVARGVRKS